MSYRRKLKYVKPSFFEQNTNDICFLYSADEEDVSLEETVSDYIFIENKRSSPMFMHRKKKNTCLLRCLRRAVGNRCHAYETKDEAYFNR